MIRIILLICLLFQPAALAAPALPPDLRLIQACLAGDADAAKAALSAGANLELRHGDKGLTPLMLAIYRDHSEMVDLLLSRGADVNALSSKQQTPLILAAAGGQREIVKVLVAKGVRLDTADAFGNTALMWAAFWGHHEVVADLLAAGADAGARNLEANTALLLAAQGGISQQALQLVSRRRNYAPNGRILPLYFQDTEQAGLLKMLIAHGAEPDTRNQLGQTALMLAAAQGRKLSLEALLAAGADPALKDEKGLLAADYARRAGFASLSRLLSTD